MFTSDTSRRIRLSILGACLLAGSILAAPTLAAGGAAGDVPRTASGRPDLSGTYDVATLTPLVRPKQYGDRLALSEEEAKEIAEHWQESLAQDATPSDPDREAPPEGGTEFYIPEFEGAAGRVGGYNAFYVDLGDSGFQIDGKYRTSILVDPPDGRFPPLTEQGRERMKAAAQDRRPNTGTAWWIDQSVGPYDGPENRPLGERCLLGFGSTQGPPMLPVMYNNYKRILQTDDYVMILVEMNHDARIVRMNSEHPPADVRNWLGDSIGWWEGDTLVVDTANFREQPGFTQASEDLHVVERFSRIDADTLLYQFTVEDPSTWTKPFSGEYVWPSTDSKVYEYACHEGNYALGNIMRGARLLEKEAKTGPRDSGGE